jgi:hypothetical protein
MGISAGLEFPNGTDANVGKSGLWLHHMILLAVGEGREDFTCRDKEISLPHILVGATSRSSERIFGSGNERSTAVFPEWGVSDAGFKMKPTDSLAAVIELMNENLTDQVVYITMTWDILDGHPFKDNIRVAWLDVRQCGTSEVTPPKGKNQFTISYNWTSSVDGEVIGAIGHVHDGGVNLALAVDGKMTCKNLAKYGTTPDYVQKSAQGMHAHGALEHISEMKACHSAEIPQKSMAKGQVWTLTADYDFDKFKGMKHEDGDWDKVMGISIVFVREKQKN